MNRADVISLMKFISMVYQNFEVNDPAKIQVWELLLRDERYDQVQAMAVQHCKTSKFPPVPADLITPKQVLSNYDIQALEQKEQQLLLEQYHKENEVVPPPDHVYEMIAEVTAKMKAGVPTDE